MKSLTIRDGRMAEEEIDGGLESMQSVVGGYIEPFFTIASPDASRTDEITGYVNEEGLLISLPLSFAARHHDEYDVPLAGNAVIVGLSEDGETRGLTAVEVERLRDIFEVHGAPFYRANEGGKTFVIPGIVARLNLARLNLARLA